MARRVGSHGTSPLPMMAPPRVAAFRSPSRHHHRRHSLPSLSLALLLAHCLLLLPLSLSLRLASAASATSAASPPAAPAPRVVELDACAVQSILPQLFPPALLSDECFRHLALYPADSSLSAHPYSHPSSLPALLPFSPAAVEPSAAAGSGDAASALNAATTTTNDASDSSDAPTATESDLLDVVRNKAATTRVWAAADVSEGTPSTLTPANEILTVCRSTAPVSITISPDLSGQTWRGWGTSLAWSANYIGKLPPDQLGQLQDLLFNASAGGIGLNLVRYLIAASFNASLSPQLTNDTMHQCNLPGYKPTQDGPYDWEADWRQRKVLAGAVERGVDEVEAIVYSPPWWMTISGDTAGNTASKTNVRPEMFGAFAEYMATIVAHFKSEWNVTFSTLNPANEPVEGWWQKGGRHEGCNFPVPDLERLFVATAAALKQKQVDTEVAGFDSFVGATGRNINKLSTRVRSSFKRISVHGYVPPPPNDTDSREFIETLYVGLARAAIGLGKEIWVSEIGPMWVVGEDLDTGLFMMRSAIQAINIMGVSAWTFWQAIVPSLPDNPNALKWSLFTITHNNVSDPTIVPLVIAFSKKFYMLKQMVRGAPRDSLPLRIGTADGCQHCVASFYNPKQNVISIFIVNQHGDNYSISFTFDSFELLDVASACVVEVQRTSASEDAAVVSADSYAQMPQTLAFIAAGRSLTSILVSNVVWL